MKILLVAKYSTIEPLGLAFLNRVICNSGNQVDNFLYASNKGVDFLNLISKNIYDYVGFSVYTGFHKQMFDLADRASCYSKVIIGGPHATFFSDECSSYADYVVKGEGFISLLKILKGEVKKGIIFEPNLIDSEMIPSPQREPLYSHSHFHRDNPIKNVMSSFGCPYTCSYCYNDSYKKLYNDFRVRYRKVESIINECDNLKKYPLKMIFFEDDCFGFNLNWLTSFMMLYKKYIHIPFHCQLRPEMVNRERIQLLTEAGCHGITLAIETFRESVRKHLLKRNYDNKLIYKACNLIKDAGLKLRTEQMLGLPLTSIKDELNLLKMNTKIHPDIAWTSIYAPYLGTTLGDYCKKTCYNDNNDNLSDNFFSDSRLTFPSQRLRETNILQKIFSTCALIPEGHLLAEEFIKGKHNFDNWFSIMRTHLYDRCLYAV